MIPRRLGPDDPALGAVLTLIRDSFAFMNGRIDPPSSMHSLTLTDLQDPTKEVWTIGDPPIACMILTPQPDTLYLGKLAVAAVARHRGLATALIAQALTRAATLQRPSVTLQTRIELTENHTTFARLGFTEIARTAHPGFDRPTTLTFRRDLSQD